MNKWNKFLVIINNFLFLPFLLIMLSNFFFSFFYNGVQNNYFFSIILSLIIIDLLFLILLCITGKNTRAYIILFIILFILFVINQIKIAYMGEPLYFSDFNFVGSSSNLLKIVSGTLVDKILSFKWYFILLIVLFVVLIWYAFKIRIDIYSIKKRIICIFVGVLGLVLLFYPFSWSKELYRSLFFLDTNDYSSYTTYVSAYSFYGVIGGMYYQLLDSRFEIPSNYNEEKLDDILMKVSESSNTNGELRTPNIIVILAESFFNVELLSDDIIFDKEVTSNFNRLKNDGKLVNLISPSYGGKTANVTFELLTGGNMSYFSNGYIPFMSLYGKKNAYQMPSIVKELSNNGYSSKIIMGQDSFNSKNVFKLLGFNEYIELEVTEENKKGYYVSDDYIADLIIQEIEAKKNKNFVMVETMQSHMDYLYSKYSKYDIGISSSNLSSNDNDILLSYAQGIYDADKMLFKIYEAIQNVDEDTIIVFFGDHLPYLENIKNANVKDNLKYFNTEDNMLNLYRLYNTQALILSNFDMNINLPNNLGFDLLLTSLINNMDINISSYYKWLFSTKDVLPAYNRYIAINKDNTLYNLNQLSGEELEIFNLRNSMMYKHFVKY